MQLWYVAIYCQAQVMKVAGLLYLVVNSPTFVYTVVKQRHCPHAVYLLFLYLHGVFYFGIQSIFFPFTSFSDYSQL